MIIDTNVYSALDKANPAIIAILAGVPKVYVPIVVIGELRFGFENGSKQTENEARLGQFLAQDTIETLLLTQETATQYGQLATFCKQSGRALSQNDIWIAALALENNMKLVTFDKDFDVFADKFGDQLIILD